METNYKYIVNRGFFSFHFSPRLQYPWQSTDFAVASCSPPEPQPGPYHSDLGSCLWKYCRFCQFGHRTRDNLPHLLVPCLMSISFCLPKPTTFSKPKAEIDPRETHKGSMRVFKITIWLMFFSLKIVLDSTHLWQLGALVSNQCPLSISYSVSTYYLTCNEHKL